MHKDDKANAISAIMVGIGSTNGTTRAVAEALVDYVEMFDKKHHDYGPGNIGALGDKGLFVRAWDKVNRLKSLLWDGKEAQAEPLVDAWWDLLGYSAIAIVLLRGQWGPD